MIERAGRVTAILKRFGEREMQRDPVLVGAACEQSLHRRHVGVVEAKALEVGQ